MTGTHVLALCLLYVCLHWLSLALRTSGFHCNRVSPPFQYISSLKRCCSKIWANYITIREFWAYTMFCCDALHWLGLYAINMQYLLVLQLIMHMICLTPKRKKEKKRKKKQNINTQASVSFLIVPIRPFGVEWFQNGGISPIAFSEYRQMGNPAIMKNGSLFSEQRGFGKTGCNTF